MHRVTRAVHAVGKPWRYIRLRLVRIILFFSRDQESPSERNAWGNR